jgi:hypothetical protein
MATTIELKNSVTTGNSPSSLLQGETAWNITDKKVWVGNASNTPIQLIGAGASMTLTSLTTSSDASISGLTVGKGGGSNAQNTAVGASALASNTSGGSNSAFGQYAGYSTTTGYANTLLGYIAGYTNSTGLLNTAVGSNAFYFNTTGSNNTAIGAQALYSNTTASNNTAVGYQALYSNTDGPNLAVGSGALYSAATAGCVFNVAVGFQAAYNTNNSFGGVVAVGDFALRANTTGIANIAIGSRVNSTTTGTLVSNTTGSYNIAVGAGALSNNTTASNNTAVGYQAGYSNTTGAGLVALGYQAGYTGSTASYNTAVGYQALQNATGQYNGAVGGFCLQSLTTGTNNNAFGLNSANKLTTGSYNTFIGDSAGYNVTTGSYNTIIGTYNGNQGGLDIRTASNYIVLSDGAGNPRVVVDSGGRTLVGGVTTNVNAGGAIFQVSQANGNWVSYIENTQATGSVYGQFLRLSGQSPNDATSMFTYMGDTTGQRMSVKSNGGIYNYSANNSNLSDQREKKNIELAPNYLDKLCQIPVKTFLFNDQTDTDLNLGVIAQDVQAVCPELVTESNWAKKDGEEKLRLSIYEADLKYAMLKAIQELKAEVDSLKQQLGK